MTFIAIMKGIGVPLDSLKRLKMSGGELESGFQAHPGYLLYNNPNPAV